MTSTNTEKDEKALIIKEKIASYRQKEGLQLNEWTAINGINTPMYYRVLNGVDVKFSAIKAIVEATENAVTYEELAELIRIKPHKNHAINELRKRGLNILKKKKQLDEADQEYGADPLETKPF